MLVQGIISDVTVRAEANAQLAEASERFSRLLDVVGAHVYLAVAFPDGRFEELFQGPGADRLLGGAEPDAEMENWNRAVHPQDRLAYEAFNRALAVGGGRRDRVPAERRGRRSRAGCSTVPRSGSARTEASRSAASSPT